METMTEFYKAIQKVQDEIGSLSKNKKNPFYNSQYFDINDLINQLQPLFKANGILLLQPITDEKVTTTLIHISTGNALESSLLLTQTDPQKKGGEITYYRRYTLQSLLGLPAEDDDGNTASGKTTPKDKNEKATPWLNPGSEKWDAALDYLANQNGTIEGIKKKYSISKANEEKLKEELKELL